MIHFSYFSFWLLLMCSQKDHSYHRWLLMDLCALFSYGFCWYQEYSSSFFGGCVLFIVILGFGLDVWHCGSFSIYFLLKFAWRKLRYCLCFCLLISTELISSERIFLVLSNIWPNWHCWGQFDWQDLCFCQVQVPCAESHTDSWL